MVLSNSRTVVLALLLICGGYHASTGGAWPGVPARKKKHFRAADGFHMGFRPLVIYVPEKIL